MPNDDETVGDKVMEQQADNVIRGRFPQRPPFVESSRLKHLLMSLALRESGLPASPRQFPPNLVEDLEGDLSPKAFDALALRLRAYSPHPEVHLEATEKLYASARLAARGRPKSEEPTPEWVPEALRLRAEKPDTSDNDLCTWLGLGWPVGKGEQKILHEPVKISRRKLRIILGKRT